MFAQCHSLCSPAPPRSRLMAGKGHSRTANLNWPKIYPWPYNNMLSNKSWGRARRRWGLSLPRCPLLSHWLGHQSGCGSWWALAFQLLLNFFFPSAILLSLTWPVSLLAFVLPIFSPTPMNTVGWGELEAVWLLGSRPVSIHHSKNSSAYKTASNTFQDAQPGSLIRPVPYPPFPSGGQSSVCCILSSFWWQNPVLHPVLRRAESDLCFIATLKLALS